MQKNFHQAPTDMRLRNFFLNLDLFQLTHGLTEKELARKGATELAITDNLKQRVKQYITAYMSKFGPIYHRT